MPWDAITVSDISDLEGFEVREYQVVMRGKRMLEEKKKH